jgi:NDP-sugar pyrophosphorylase family protein
MKKYKVCILSAGVGTRMGPLSENVNKSVLPINFKAVISHIIEKFDKDTEFVIALGHKKDTVKNYIKLAHPKCNITYVEIDKFIGPGSGPGYSLLACKDYLQCPFVFFASDTIVLESIPDVDNNWLGICSVKNPKDFCTVKIKDNLIVQIDDKIITNNKYAFIGLAGIKDYKFFFDTLENSTQLINKELQVSNGFKGLLEYKLEPVGFTWFDTGNFDNFKITNNHLSGEEKKFDFSKGDEFLYFVKDRVIKYFKDEKIASNRVKRAKLMSGLTPIIENSKPNFYSYKKLNGDVLYNVLNDKIFSNFLSWCKDKLWIKKKFSNNDEKKIFKNACERFYIKKTNDRLDKFYKKTSITDEEIIINGKKVPSVKNLFSKINWEHITDGIASGFHGDLQFDNILLQTNGDFKILDWRQDFAGIIEYGDMYYDLSKLYGGMNLSYQSIKNEKFSFEMTNDKVYYEYNLKNNLVESRDVFEEFLLFNKLDFKKISILTGIIYLNMAVLHHDPFDRLLYFLGRSMIDKSLKKN